MGTQPNTPRTVWQLSSGPGNRSYRDVLLHYQLGLIGAGDAGPWQPGRADADFEGNYVRRFASEMQIGDAVLLRAGISAVCAVGLVASAYQYLPQFDDVNGWDLQHARRIRWYTLPTTYDFGEHVFGANPPRLSKIAAPRIIEYAESFVNSPPTTWQSKTLPELPVEDPRLDHPPPALAGLIDQVNDLADLYWDRDRFGDHPAEDELLAHFIVPFLHALGWPAELIAVKWRFVDVALFRALPRSPDTLYLVIEAKRLGAGVEGALQQARGYLDDLGVSRNIVVSDGIRYRMYQAATEFSPCAYANLARLKIPALDLFTRLTRP